MTRQSTSYRRALSDVGWLQTAYAEAEPGARARPAGLLGLALADLSDLVEDGDGQLPSLLQQGLERLAEAREDREVGTALGLLLPLRAGMLRWRAARQAGQPEPVDVDQVISELCEAFGPTWSTPPELGPLAGPRWCLADALLYRYSLGGREEDLASAGAHSIEALIEQGSSSWQQAPQDGPAWSAAARWQATAARAWQKSGPGGPRVPARHWPQAAPRARQLLARMEPGHVLRPVLRAMSVGDVLQEAARTERWPEHADAVLADLRAVPELWGDDSSAQERRLARSLALQLGCMRLALEAKQVGDPAKLDLTELDALHAELEALRALPHPQSDDPMAVTMRHAVEHSGFFVGGLLATRAGVDNSLDGGVPDPADLARSRELLQNVPPEWAREAEALLGGLSLVRPDVDDVPQASSVLDQVGDIDPPYYDEMGGRIAGVLARARQAIAARDVQAVLGTLPTVQDALRGLSPGHPARPELLAIQATLLGLRAALGSGPQDVAAALHAAVGAAEAAALLGRDQSRQVCDAVTLGLVGAIGQDLTVGPFARGRAALEAALAAGLAENERQRVHWRIGVVAASALCWVELDQQARQQARETVADIERALYKLPAEPMAVGAGFELFLVLAHLGLARGNLPLSAAMQRVLDHLDQRLAEPGLAHAMEDLPDVPAPAALQLPGSTPLPGGVAGMRVALTQLRGLATQLAGAQPPPMPAPPSDVEVGLRVEAALRAARRALDGNEPSRLVEASELLTRVMAQGVSKPQQREDLHAALGRCRAAAAGVLDGAPVASDSPEAAVHLAEAVRHLELATAERTYPLPSAVQADLLDLLARCQRARGQGKAASEVARAALREVLGTVLAAENDEEAVAAADRSHRISSRAAWWSLEDGDPEQAMGMAESGRALVLASVVLSGRVQEQLTAMGREDLAEAWTGDDQIARATALAELTTTYPGFSTLAAPRFGQLAAVAFGSGMDGAAYLLPPKDPDGRDGILLLVGRGARPRAIPLSGLSVAVGSPVHRYQRAFAAAVAAHQAAAQEAAADGVPAPRFRETAQGREWSAALDDLGTWTYGRVIGPLLDQVGDWNLRRPAHLSLIPVGDLGAIPFAAAWTADPTRPGGRRYAVHDLVLSHIASARMLSDVARRDRLQLQERAVLVTDPRGTLPYARLAAHAVHKTLLPHATCYWPGSGAPETKPTRARILAALPADGRDGASLLHLATHGHAALRPLESVLEVSDGELRVGDILAQARGRDPHAPGGLVICDACLTDTTRVQPDESLTLATAFLTAGATAVIGTRWPTDDSAAAALAVRLHHELASGHSPAQALRHAQLALLDGEPAPPGTPPPLRRPKQPDAWADWAAFVHHGV